MELLFHNVVHYCVFFVTSISPDNAFKRTVFVMSELTVQFNE